MTQVLKFARASKQAAKVRMALIGPAGAGKTYTALNIASNLAAKIAVIDTERGSASKYSGEFSFDVLELTNFAPQNYVAAIEAASQAGYDCLVIDSLSHAWMGVGGTLEMVDKLAKRSQTHNTFGAWRDVTPQHNAMVEAILASPMHIIATMRAKTEYVQEKDQRTGKTTVRKIGLAPIQKDGLEYEMDVVADLDIENNFIVSKTRCPALSGQVFNKAGRDVANIIKHWLTDDAAPHVEPERKSDQRLALEADANDVADEAAPLFKKGRPAPPLDEDDETLSKWIDACRTKIAEKLQEVSQSSKPAGEKGEDFEGAKPHVLKLVQAATDRGLDVGNDAARITATNAFFEGTQFGPYTDWLSIPIAPAKLMLNSIESGDLKWGAK